MRARPRALDLFAGAGGTTTGLEAAGFHVLAGFENDSAAAATYAANHGQRTRVVVDDLLTVLPSDIAATLKLEPGALELLAGCPPCQPFSTLGLRNAADPRHELVGVVSRFAEELRPQALLLENVPGLATSAPLKRLISRLRRWYQVKEYLVQAADFGVPQSRRRYFMVGLRRDIGFVLPTDIVEAVLATRPVHPRPAESVFAAVRGRTEAADAMHRGRKLTDLSVRRLRSTSPGGGRRELPDELALECHKRLGTRSAATSIYGRIDPTKPAPTMTTRCTTPSCGRFGHPTEDRGITLREASLFQTFPDGYDFRGTYGDIERQIGNAVPPRLAQMLGQWLRENPLSAPVAATKGDAVAGARSTR